MARIEGVDLPRKKRVEIGLTYLFGVGSNTFACKFWPPPRSARTRGSSDLTEAEVAAMRELHYQELQGGRRPAPRGADEYQAPDRDRLLSRSCVIAATCRYMVSARARIPATARAPRRPWPARSPARRQEEVIHREQRTARDEYGTISSSVHASHGAPRKQAQPVLRAGAHLCIVQQYDRDGDRSSRATPSPGARPVRRASRARARARPLPPAWPPRRRSRLPSSWAWPGSRSVCQGPWPGPRGRHSRHSEHWLPGPLDVGYDPDGAQWLPAAQEAPRVIMERK